MRQSGVYYLQIRGTTYWFLKVFCDQEIADGGWTVNIFKIEFLDPKIQQFFFKKKRLFKEEMILVNLEKISIVIGLITKMVLVIHQKNFGWEMKIFTC